MKNILKLAAIPAALFLCSGPAHAQNTPTPKPEDAEKNAFQTPTTGKKDATDSSGKANSRDMNPEGRLNDNPPAHEKVGTSNTPSK
jgi:hypothetical protein